MNLCWSLNGCSVIGVPGNRDRINPMAAMEALQYVIGSYLVWSDWIDCIGAHDDHCGLMAVPMVQGLEYEHIWP